MEKKHISIIGTCISRELFNTSLLSEIFDVDCYAFQICTFDLLNTGLNIPKEVIYKASTEEFTTRMFWYDLDKVTLSEIEKHNSEYLIIDLHSIIGKVIEVTYNNESVYTQSSMSRILTFIKSIEQDGIGELKDLTYKEIPLKEFNKEIIKQGLLNLANWAKKHFDENKIIVYIPEYALKYISLSGNIFEYDEDKKKIANTHNALTREFSEMLIQGVPDCVVLDDIGNKVAQFGSYDNLETNTPPQTHYSKVDHLKQGYKLLELLHILPEKPLSFHIEKMLLQKTNEVISLNFKYNKSFKNVLTLNDYFSKIENLRDVIVIISAYDEASKMIKYFRNKNLLGIKADIGWRSSYIAVVDKCRNLTYENTSQERLTYDYLVNDKHIHIISSGFNAGNESSIKIDDGKELSKSKRGLNIVLLNSHTLEVVDSAYCDTYNDKELKIFSDYFNNVKIKI